MSLLKNIKHIHFVGIGGVGMCGIAKILHQKGYQVSGSDLNQSAVTKQLEKLGLTVFSKHHPSHINDVDMLVRSTAINSDNIEINTAIKAGIPIVARAEMLAELMYNKQGIAIAGTHGKTTTTSLLTHILLSANVDPTFVIGGKLNSLNTHAQLGQSDYVVAEADESDASFLHLKPTMAVITNIDADHMSTYNNDLNQLHQTFINFLETLPKEGLIVLCIDDPTVKKLTPKLSAPLLTYGFDKDADFQACHYQQKALTSHFTLLRKNTAPLAIEFNLPGKHNIQNALAAIVIASHIGVSDKDIQSALLSFQGVARRFQILGDLLFNKGKATLIDDYGHHPKEIDSTLSAIRSVWPEKRLVHVFQPHRYSRTKDLFNDFTKALEKADLLIILDIYSAGEAPIKGISSETLANNIRLINQSKNVQVGCLETLENTLSLLINEGDILLMQGAGSVSQAAHTLFKKKALNANG